MENQNDLIIRLDQKVEDLSARVERGFSEIKDNTTGKLNDHEKRLQDLEVTRVNFRSKIEGINRFILVLMAIGVVLAGLVIWCLTKYPIP